MLLARSEVHFLNRRRGKRRPHFGVGVSRRNPGEGSRGTDKMEKYTLENSEPETSHEMLSGRMEEQAAQFGEQESLSQSQDRLIWPQKFLSKEMGNSAVPCRGSYRELGQSKTPMGASVDGYVGNPGKY
ncbi:hypothetical protein E2320_014386 [Naja naja]|nr:hypothetical protein E2320_014386 [Naja naja]